MRLLLQDGTGEFSFREFRDHEIPPYAILSHTWFAVQEGFEPTYEDLKDGSGKEKLGYKKIQFCGEQARRDGLQYFWVDTCCINKANYAELQYAINSMFRWYRNATRCYVYLSDVTSPPLTTNDFNPQSWDSEFWSSRWFTRGWTLQELLAPRSVEFFCREGRRLGDKNSLKHQIQAITGIPALALQGAALFQFSAEDRLSWIDRRQTTLEVDRVYSLLGILDVKIPLFKDTEAATAFERLREVIDKREVCIQDLRLTDPRDDKKRIEDTKGGLLEDSCRWIFGMPEFKQWHDNQLGALLWIKGDPGKGKTMLLCGIINELNKTTFDTALLSYFFCQATDSRINSATGVLRGLIYMLVSQRPSLVSHIQKKYNDAGKALFEDANAWTALVEIFTNILQDSTLGDIHLIVDALDECVTGLPELLDFIVHTSSILSRAKWIVSSRNWSSIERSLDAAGHRVRLSLELNEKSVAAALATYIQFKVDWLAERNRYSSETGEFVQSYLSQNANGTFLWVALVCKELSKIPGWRAKKKVTAFPPELDPFYRRMMDQISGVEDTDDKELCTQILAVASAVYRPVTLDELSSFIDIPDEIAGNYEALSEIIGLCGSFLTLREHIVLFVHQSAKDFLIKECDNEIYPFGVVVVHHTLFSRSLQAMSKTLRRDIYSLRAPGISINEVTVPNPDPLAVARYSCLYWVDHLLDCGTGTSTISYVEDCGLVLEFLRQSFLYWLEALSLMKGISDGILMIRKLENWLQADKSTDIYVFVLDSIRFALYNRVAIEQAPLQLYCSALIFAPKKSAIRAAFEKHIPPWIQIRPKVQAYWSAALVTFEGHSGWVLSVAFSPDGMTIVSGSADNTVRLWDTTTGALLRTLKGHSGSVDSVAVSPKGKEIVSGSRDTTLRLWDAATGSLLQTFEGHSSRVLSVAFLPNGKNIISGSSDATVGLWNTTTGALLYTLKDNFGYVLSVAFSHDGKQVVSGSNDSKVRLWDATTGALLQKLEGHHIGVLSVAFSPDGKRVVSSHGNTTIHIWDTVTGALLHIIKCRYGPVSSVAFSPNSKQIVSSDKTIQLWDAATGVLLQTFKGHSHRVLSVAFSPDGNQIVYGSGDKTLRLWDTATRASIQTLKGHPDYINISSVAFSSDGKRVASGSYKSVQLWDATTGAPLLRLKSKSAQVKPVAFSPNSKMIISGSDKIVQLWDTTTGAPLLELKGHSELVTSVAFSPDSEMIVSASYDEIVRLWDTATGALLQTLQADVDYILSVAFSPNGKQVVSCGDTTVQLWDAVTGALLQTVKGHHYHTSSVAFSPNGKQIVSCDDKTVQLLDAATGALLQTLKGHPICASSMIFSPDGEVVSTSLNKSNEWIQDGDVKILWLPPDYRSPTCMALWNRNLVFGYNSGRISLFGFQDGLKGL